MLWKEAAMNKIQKQSPILNRPTSFDDIPLILTVEELMPILGIGRNTAFALVRSGEIRTIRTGKQIRILKHDLLDFLKGGDNHAAE